jgi:lipid A 3-O-deacylase
LPVRINFISDWTFINQGNKQQYSISYGLSQSMFTPSDISEPELIENDRPYAGTLLWHTKIRQFSNNRANSLGLTLGIAGPASLAEQSQTIIHGAIGATTPEGWDNQINNELVFRIDAEHIERFYDYKFSDTISFDTSSYSEAGIGNLRSDIGTGLTLRIGNLLDETYASINPINSQPTSVLTSKVGKQFYWQLFTSVYGSYVFNDITLNGNTFSDSHSIEMINEQALISAGLYVMYHQWGMAFSTHSGTEQFEGQQGVSKYGSITISYQY